MIYSTSKDGVMLIAFECIETNIVKLEETYINNGFDQVKFEYSYAILQDGTYSDFTENKVDFLNIIKQHETVYIKLRLSIISHNDSYKFAYFELENIDNMSVSNIERSIDDKLGLVINSNKNKYDPYKIASKCGVEVKKRLDKIASDIASFDCMFFKTEQDKESMSVTFKTYTLSTVTEYKELPIVIKDNIIPDNRFDYSAYDIDYQDELEVHINIEVFKSVFGDKEPSVRDFLYLPLTNRMYEINNVYDQKDFMYKSTYYRASLVKYEDRASVNDSYISDNYGSEYDIDSDYSIDNINYEEDINKDERVIEENNATREKEVTISDDVKNINEIYFLDLTSTKNSDYAREYPLSNISKELNVMLRVNAYNVRINDIFALFNGNEEVLKYSYKLRNSVIDFSTTDQNNILSSRTNKINKDTSYIISVNYAFNEKGRFVTLTLLDEQGQILHDEIKDVDKELNVIDSLKIFGGNYISDISVRKEIVMKDEIMNIINNSMKDNKDYYVIDRFVPSFGSYDKWFYPNNESANLE